MIDRIAAEPPKRFKVMRRTDVSGVSGTGHVADGVMFWNGHCVICWRTAASSIAIYESIEDLMAIHGHDGNTEIIWES
jgi:hypothetical protein